MSFTETDRFPELRDDLNPIFSRSRIWEIASEKLRAPADRFVFEALSWAPEGSTAPIGGRPSLRIWNKTFAASWATPNITPVRKDPGALVQIPLDHPSVRGEWEGDILDWIIHGTPPHIIDGNQLLSFHWGSPLRWPAKDGFGSGSRVFPFVDHPGASPGVDFVTRAINVTDEQFRQAKEETAAEVMFNPLDDSELLKRTA